MTDRDTVCETHAISVFTQ